MFGYRKENILTEISLRPSANQILSPSQQTNPSWDDVIAPRFLSYFLSSPLGSQIPPTFISSTSSRPSPGLWYAPSECQLTSARLTECPNKTPRLPLCTPFVCRSPVIVAGRSSRSRGPSVSLGGAAPWASSEPPDKELEWKHSLFRWNTVRVSEGSGGKERAGL